MNEQELVIAADRIYNQPMNKWPAPLFDHVSDVRQAIGASGDVILTAIMRFLRVNEGQDQNLPAARERATAEFKREMNEAH